MPAAITASALAESQRLPLPPIRLTWANSLIGLWVLTLIAIPILRWTVGDAALRWGVTLSVLLLATAVILLLWQTWGAAVTGRILAILLPGAWLIEWIGSNTGWPFGSYEYTNVLQPQLFHVPLLIPIAWLMMLPPAWAVAYRIVGVRRGWRFVVTSALAFTAWDLFLDPQMVAWGFWVWTPPGGYFGIPWLNFFGWLISAALLTWLARPPMPPLTPLVTIYAITWILQSIGQFFFWQQPGPALAGFAGMGFFLWLALSRSR